MNRWTVGTGILATAAAIAIGFALPSALAAGASTPQRMVYNGHLLDANGNAITTAHTVRFSLWTSADEATGDVTATGAIHIAAATYAGWKEAFTVTPDAQGYFSAELGSTVALPDFSTLSADTLASLHLQVEVKVSADPATAYEVLDVDPADASVDRSPLRSVPFALNADLLDRHPAGTGSGAIPVLGSGGLLPTSTISGGTNRGTFTIDAGNAVTDGSISLRFGDSLGKALSYDVTESHFTFNDHVEVQGNLTVTGLVNGVNVVLLKNATDNAHLKVSTGAGLSVNVAQGDYRLGGTVTSYAGTNGVAVADDATNSLFFTSTGLTVTTAGFPTQTAYIPLATVETAGGAITAMTDRRILNANDTQHTVDRVFQPLYEGAVYEGDGSENVGQLTVAHSGSVLTNYYQWTSTRATLQTYDIVLRAPLPRDFARWGSPALSLTYHSASADAAESNLGITVDDTAGNAVSLTGSGTANLTGTSWTTATWGFSGSPTWTAGGEILIRLHLASRNNTAIFLGPLTLRYVEVLSE